MPKRIALTSLNASTVDILNTIRQNASYEYQSLVPEITQSTDIPKVGEVLFGYPAMANQFINALVNRIALVKINSAVFNNAYKELKKGYLEFGETVEEVFVSIAKAREFSAEKAEARELKRYIPDVKSAFHIMNYRAMYNISIEQQDLRRAFTSEQGVQDLIARLVDSVYTAAEYDEFLLFKYLLIKAVSHGKMYPVAFDSTDDKKAGVAFRGYSNLLPFMSNKFNASGVTTTTPKADQHIFMSAAYNAQYDINVLASAFNMDKATFAGKLHIIDDFTTFDNDRFSEIRAGSDMIEEVTAAELALMADVKAILVDTEWFQMYDNLNTMTEKFVAAGIRWNYFYHVWKTVSYSPFSNAIVFVDDGATISTPSTLTLTVVGKETSDNATILTCSVDAASASVAPNTAKFVQTEDATEDGIAVHPYGAIIVPTLSPAVSYVPVVTLGDDQYSESTESTPTALGASTDVGDTITLTKES